MTDPATIAARIAANDKRQTELLLERRRLMVSARASGQTLEEIGRTWGLTRARVGRILARDLVREIRED